PLSTIDAAWSGRGPAVKSVRNHQGTWNSGTVSGPTVSIRPKQRRRLSEKKTLWASIGGPSWIADPGACGRIPFWRIASISVPGAPASSGLTGSQPAVGNPGVETCSPGCVTTRVLWTVQPCRPMVERPRPAAPDGAAADAGPAAWPDADET